MSDGYPTAENGAIWRLTAVAEERIALENERLRAELLELGSPGSQNGEVCLVFQPKRGDLGMSSAHRHARALAQRQAERTQYHAT